MRALKNRIMTLLLALCAALLVLPLVAILVHLVAEGASALDAAFFLEAQKPVGEAGGGMAHSIAGTAVLVGLASGIGIPLGLACGIYLAEYGRGERLASWVRFALQILASTPSILVGVLVYGLVVVPMKGFSALGGAIALSVILLPLVARTSEEILRLLPGSVREAGLALGIPRHRVILKVVLRAVRPAIVSAILLGVARIAGETAPLVFTAFGSPGFPRSLAQPVSALPLQIYTYAISPYEEWHRMAWAGAALLVVGVLVVNGATRWLTRERARKGGGLHEDRST